MSDIDKTIATLKDAFKELGEQLLGNKEQTPFMDTLGDYDSLKDLLDDLFNTDSYNTEWVNLVSNPDNYEEKEGVRLRIIVGFMSMWKKALLRACTKKTDVDVVFNDDVGYINSGMNSLEITKLNVAKPDTTK